MKSNIELAKKLMFNYVDFFGGDIPNKDEIANAKTLDDLRLIISKHEAELESMLSDAMSHINETLRKKINELE